MDKIIVSEIKKKKNRVSVYVDCFGKAKKFIKKNERTFFIEYNEDIEQVPDSILMSPFYYNLSPLAWFLGIDIVFPIIENEVLKSSYKLINSFKEIYPQSNPNGDRVYVNNVEKIDYQQKIQSATLFSGGVDSWASFLEHYEERPVICTVWGSDIKLDDHAGWELVNNNIEEIASNFEVHRFIAKSNFRDILNYYWINEAAKEMIQANWWHDIQHGMSLISLFAPLCYLHGVHNLIVPGTNSIFGNNPIASEPRIDNNVKISNLSGYHDQFDKNRQMKVNVITKYSKLNNRRIPLRVCYEGRGGNNCCHCEKCIRTIISLYSEGVNPEEYGFNSIDKKYIIDFLNSKKWNVNSNSINYYKESKNKASINNVKGIRIIDTLNSIDFNKIEKKNIVHKNYFIKNKLRKVKHVIFDHY